MGDGSGRAGLVERRGDGGALRREACPAGAERAGPKRNGESVPASRECPGPVPPAREGERGQDRLPRGGTAGRNQASQRHLWSGAPGRRALLSAGRLRERPRPLRPSNQGAPARPERKALWDGGGKRGAVGLPRQRAALRRHRSRSGTGPAGREGSVRAGRGRCGPGTAAALGEAAGSGAGGLGAMAHREGSCRAGR